MDFLWKVFKVKVNSYFEEKMISNCENKDKDHSLEISVVYENYKSNGIEFTNAHILYPNGFLDSRDWILLPLKCHKC